MSLIKAIKQQLGLSVTPANNFTLDASADNGTMKLARGNAGATTQDIMTVDAAGGVAIRGRTVNPSAGNIGELIVSAGSSVIVTNVTQQTIETLNLTAGVWDVVGFMRWSSAGTHTITRLDISISQTNNTSNVVGNSQIYDSMNFNPGATGALSHSTPPTRVVLSAPAIVYLVALTIHTNPGLTANGQIYARRVA